MGVTLKRQQKPTVHTCMETNALSGFALLLATWLGLADTEVRGASGRVADPQKGPAEGVRAQGASVCGLKQPPLDLRAAQGIQCGQAADNRPSKLKAAKR